MPQRVEFANQLRGIAALSVLIAHLFGNFWLYPKIIENLTLSGPHHVSSVPWLIQTINSIPYFYLGPFGVALFFLISGFVIPYSLNASSTALFALRRFIRIVPLYMIAFLITATGVYCCAKANGIGFPYKGTQLLIHAIPGLRNFFDIPQIDGIVWTLEIEIKFYLLCMLFRRWLFDARILLIPFILLMIQLVFLPSYYDFYIQFRHLSFILIGTVYYLMREGKISSELGMFGSLLIFGLLIRTALLIPNHVETGFWTACLWAQGWALLIFFAAASFPWITSSRILTFFAKISYPLYLIHGVLGYILMVYLHRLSIHPLLTSLIGSSAVVVLAYGLHVLFEKPLLNYSSNLTRKTHSNLF